MIITHQDNIFTITEREWAGTYPLGELPNWLEFSRKRQADFPKAYGAYDAIVDELEALAEKLRIHQD